MKLILKIFIMLSPGLALANLSPTIDDIKSLGCTVLSVPPTEISGSYIPPEPGDRIIFTTWALNIFQMEFSSEKNHKKSYVSLPVTLERVDHSGMRSPNLRTFVGIKESMAFSSRVEARLVLKSNDSALLAIYSKVSKSLSTGQVVDHGSIEMDCTANELW